MKILIFVLAIVVITGVFLFSGFDTLRNKPPIKMGGESATTTLKNPSGYLDQFISEGNSLENKPTSNTISNTRAIENNSFMPPNFIGPSGPPSVVGPSGPPPGY